MPRTTAIGSTASPFGLFSNFFSQKEANKPSFRLCATSRPPKRRHKAQSHREKKENNLKKKF
jgi:hypothetical protein